MGESGVSGSEIRTTHGMPPGPKGLPLVGTLFDFARHEIAFFERVARDHGDIAAFNFAGWKCLYLGDMAGIEQVVLKDHRIFIKNRLGLRHTVRLFGQGMLTSEGALWQQQHRVAAPTFAKRRISNYGSEIVDAARSVVDGWQDDQVIDVMQPMRKLTLYVVARTILGSDIRPHLDDLTTALAGVTLEIESRIKRPFTIPDAIPLPGNLRYRRAIERIDRVVADIIARHQDTALGVRDDLLSQFIAFRDGSGTELSYEQLRDEVVTLMQAGHETTALALTWAFYLLGRDAEGIRRATEEVQAVVGDRPLTVDDVPQLRFIEGIVLEAMRLFPPVWIIGREAIAPFTLNGYEFPAGTTVLICPWVLQRDPRYYAAPEEFRPERWLTIRGTGLPRFAYMPFGGGPRICIGQSFAMMEAVLILGTILQRFSVECVNDAPVRPFPSFTLRPGSPIRVRLKALQ